MGPRGTIVAGLAAGVTTAAVLLVVVVMLAPPAFPVATATPGASGTPAAVSTPSSSTAATAVPTGVASIAPAAFHIGEPAPALRIAQVGGGQIDLAALHGQPVWINFMQTTCPPCRDEFPIMNGFAVRYADAGLVVIAVDVREEEGVIGSFAQDLNVRFPIGLDPDGAAATRWGAVALPVHFWVDTDGIIRAGALGGIGPDMMAESLAKILPGVDVTP